MAKIFITGSSDGLGLFAAKKLVNEGHQVVLHARNESRGQHAMDQCPGAETVLIGDLSNEKETLQLAEHANAWGTFDAVIHNAAVYAVDYTTIFAVNVIAPYLLTAKMHLPRRLVYLSSGDHRNGRAFLQTAVKSGVSYADSKFFISAFACAIARRYPDVYSNSVDPGWVATKMGGAGAPDDLVKGYETQSWLAVSDEPSAKVSGKYFYHEQTHAPKSGVEDSDLQEQMIAICEDHTGIQLPD